MITTKFKQAAWAAYQADAELLARREAAAALWTQRRCAEEGLKGVLRVPAYAHSYRDEEDPVSAFARRNIVVTNRGRPAGEHRPHLVSYASPELLCSAMLAANGSSICATETPTFPLAGWAMVTGAMDLMSGDVTPSTITTEQSSRLEHLAAQGYNSWSSDPGKRTAPFLMSELAESGLPYRIFVGALVALTPQHADLKSLERHLPSAWVRERQELHTFIW